MKWENEYNQSKQANQKEMKGLDLKLFKKIPKCIRLKKRLLNLGIIPSEHLEWWVYFHHETSQQNDVKHQALLSTQINWRQSYSLLPLLSIKAFIAKKKDNERECL